MSPDEDYLFKPPDDEPPVVPDNVVIIFGETMKVMTPDEYLRHLLVDCERAPDWFTGK